jgi:hypothetical protein
MSCHHYRSQRLKATMPLLHNLMRERTGMITDLWRKRKNLLYPPYGGAGLRRVGPPGIIVTEPEADHQLRRGSRR